MDILGKYQVGILKEQLNLHEYIYLGVSKASKNTCIIYFNTHNVIVQEIQEQTQGLSQCLRQLYQEGRQDQIIQIGAQLMEQLHKLLNINTSSFQCRVLLDVSLSMIFIDKNGRIIIPTYLLYGLISSSLKQTYIQYIMTQFCEFLNSDSLFKNQIKRNGYIPYICQYQTQQQLIYNGQNEVCDKMIILLKNYMQMSTEQTHIYSDPELKQLNFVHQLLQSGMNLSAQQYAIYNVTIINSSWNPNLNKYQHIMSQQFTKNPVDQSTLRYQIAKLITIRTNQLKLLEEKVIEFITTRLEKQPEALGQGFETQTQQLNKVGIDIDECFEIVDYKDKPQQSKIRLTASRFYNICQTHNYLKYNVQDQNVTSPAIEHGNQFEKTAIEIYSQHNGVVVQPCDVLVSKAYPWIAGKPDGLVQMNGEIQGIIEVKCPYNSKDKVFIDIVKDPNSYIYQDQWNQHQLKKNHSYYYQIQGYLFITGCTWCDFVVYTFNETLTIRIDRDTEFIIKMVSELTNQYFSVRIPQLLQIDRVELDDKTIESIIDQYRQ